MEPRTQRSARRADALTRERIVAAAIDILDTEGEDALTFRALTTRLTTGAGAIYWHVANKDELLAAATNDVITRVMSEVVNGEDPHEAIRAIALGVFDAIDAHPWAGARLAREREQTAMLQIFEGIGQQLLALRVPEHALFDAASVLLNYILGVAGQNAANARLHAGESDRSAFLAAISTQWTRNDPATHPFVHTVAAQLREHDDRAQFLAGIDLILTGVPATQVGESTPRHGLAVERSESASTRPRPTGR